MLRLTDAIEKFKAAKILVIGDIIVDRYLFGSATRISPEAPVPVVDVEREDMRLGGAANVFNNICKLGGVGTLCGVIGEDRIGDYVSSVVSDMGGLPEGLIRTPSRRTTIKTRIVAHQQQVVRYDLEDRTDVNGSLLAKFYRFFDEHLCDYDAIIVSDYIKGVVNEQLMDRVRLCRGRDGGKPMVVDPKPRKPERFIGATVITPNQSEAELMVGQRIVSSESLRTVGIKLLHSLQVQAVLITRGAKGMALFELPDSMVEIPAVAKNVFDVTGAGDTAAAVFTLCLVAGLSFLDSARIANVAAGIVVGKVGTETITIEELAKGLDDESSCS